MCLGETLCILSGVCPTTLVGNWQRNWPARDIKSNLPRPSKFHAACVNGFPTSYIPLNEGSPTPLHYPLQWGRQTTMCYRQYEFN